MQNSTMHEIQTVANDALSDTANLYSDLKELLSHEKMHVPTQEQIVRWKSVAITTNMAISQIVRMLWTVDDRHKVEKSILVETVNRDTIDREATFAHTWSKLRQETVKVGDDGSSVCIDKAQAAVRQVETALAALAPVPNTDYHGAPALARLSKHQ